MDKLTRISLVLAGSLLAPAFFAGACGGDDSTPNAGGTGGSGGSGGAAGTTGGTAGATGGSGGSTGGSAGSGGSGGSTGGSGGSAGSATGGTAGKGGAAGSATGGTAGKAGSAGAGTAGTGGGTTDGGAGTAGTGGSAGGTPDGGKDAASDGSAGDGGLNTCHQPEAMNLTCDDLCTTFMSICAPIAMWSSTYADKADCMTKCAPLAQAALCCRLQHIGFARDTDAGTARSTHCGHAVGGNSTCM